MPLDSWNFFATGGAFIVLAVFVWLRSHALGDPPDAPPAQTQAIGDGSSSVPKPESVPNVPDTLIAPLAEKTDRGDSGSPTPPSNLSQDTPQLTIAPQTRRSGRSRPLPLLPRGFPARGSSLDTDSLSDSEAFDDIALLGKSSTRVSHKVRRRATDVLYVRKSMTQRELPIDDIVKELKRMKEVRHPNVVKCFSVFPTPNVAYKEVTVVMEFCEGGSLESARKAIKARGGVVEEKVVGRIAEGILQGLAHLHGMDILHRDIKPTNLLFSKEGVVKLSEFAVAGDSIGEIGDTFMGSLVYTAPERIDGDGCSIGVDIWAMGISLLEFVHKKSPYPPSLSPMDILLRIRNGEPPRLKDLDGVIWSEEMKNFFETVLRIDPKTRPDAHALLGHPWIASVMKQEVAMEKWMRRVSMKQATHG